MTVQETLVEMLCRWHEAQDPAFAPGHFGGSGGSGIGLPATWNDSYRLLDELLRGLRDGAHRREHTHLVARYRDAPIVRMRVKVAYGRLRPPDHVDVVAGQHGKGDRYADVLVRDARHVVFERNDRGAYRRTHPSTVVVSRALEVVERRWFERRAQPPFLPMEFVTATAGAAA